MPSVDEAFNIQPQTDRELSLSIIRKWSKDNSSSQNIDWRQVHAAANILAIEALDIAELSADAWRAMSRAEDDLAMAEAKSFAMVFLDLIHGRAKGPNGEDIPQVSTSQAQNMASKLATYRIEVVEAKNAYSIAKARYMKLTKQADALIEIEQSGKSTAQRLMNEPR